MSHDETQSTDRRKFLQAGAVASAAALSLAHGVSAQDAAKAPTIPRRRLGKTGVDITMLEQGSIRGESFDRIIRVAYERGVRVFDTARVYGTEPSLKKWFEQKPEVRKEIFLVTKDNPKKPADMLGQLDKRLAALGTDYIDLFFIHGLGDDHSVDQALNFVKSQEFKETAEAIRKSGKAKFVGFSCHHIDRGLMIQAAAERGVVDAIMLQYSPWLDPDSPLNKALDTCHQKGVGLITMKQTAGKFLGDKPQEKVLDQVVRKVPWLAEKKLTPWQGLLHAIWTDERITASCVSMKNLDQIRDNADAAVRFAPLKLSQIHQLRDAAIEHSQMLCADCDGRCSLAAGTNAELGNLTRFLTYHEHHGDRSVARAEYAKLSNEARDWSGADLVAAQEACPNKLNFSKLMPEVDRHLA
jgi:predicted aldo/keto reductase-like oxidoreductase